MFKLNLFKPLVLGLAFLVSFKSNSQCTISGSVKDADNGELLIGAYITNGVVMLLLI